MYGVQQACFKVLRKLVGIYRICLALSTHICRWDECRIDHHALYACSPKCTTQGIVERAAFVCTALAGITIALMKKDDQGFASAIKGCVG
jgi:hypothetical protein